MKSHAIADIRATEILDSRGTPTIEATVTLGSGAQATESVPSGASTGQFEAWELRDGDPKRYNGKGVLQACKNVETVIKDALKGADATAQRAIDTTLIELDGTPNKKNLGANAILAVSLAVAHAAARSTVKPLYHHIRSTFGLTEKAYRLPEPMMNVINGGVHADNGLDVQEFMIVPHAETFSSRLRMGAEIVMRLSEVLRMKGLQTLVGDEGGFAPRLGSNRAPFDLMVEAVERSSYALRTDVHFALDAAASEFYHPAEQRYLLRLEQRSLNAHELVTYYRELCTDYPILSLEDGCADEDWDGWKELTKQLKGKLMLVGDDLFVTNVTRLQRGIDEGAASAILVKPNQIGTLSETIDTVTMAKKANMPFILSHRSGETDDAFISDLAVALNAPYIKAGSVLRGERVAKYNRLLEIEQELA